MNVLDLFSGLGGWSEAFKDRGHRVVTIDILAKFNPTICIDIMNIDNISKYGNFDIILASPPCNCFSVASIGKHWVGKEIKYTPKDEETKKAILLVQHTLKLIEEHNPKFWILENPMGILRKLSFMQKYEHRFVTYCQYGEHRMKPTDLWGKFPKLFIAKSCKNGDLCHDRAPRGSHIGGTQGIKSSEERAKIPYGLSLAICIACEEELKQIKRKEMKEG